MLLVLLLVVMTKMLVYAVFIGINEDGARWRFRTSDPYRVKVMLYH